jgi:hypothetical protein
VIALVCTDCGQHTRCVLTYDEDLLVLVDDAGADLAPMRPMPAVLIEQRPDGGITYTFVCPRCPRRPKLGENGLALLWRVLAAARAEGLSDVDVSRLPFC